MASVETGFLPLPSPVQVWVQTDPKEGTFTEGLALQYKKYRDGNVQNVVHLLGGKRVIVNNKNLRFIKPKPKNQVDDGPGGVGGAGGVDKGATTLTK